VKPLTETDIRSSFVNASALEVEQIPIPGLHEMLWDEREFLGWRDHSAPLRGYIVSWIDGRPVGIQVRTAGGNRRGIAGMCSLCHTPQPMTQVSLFSAPKAGAAGENGDTLGTYICDDLACSLIIRMAPPHLNPPEMLQRKADGLLKRVQNFTSDVMKTA
jgi:FBP C-terminal treble-clef zinc-finger